jgi:predicted nucleic acid-binding protein
LTATLLLDAGPLVALLSERDRYHPWAVQTFTNLSGSLLSCEAVIAEACFLLRGAPKAVDAIWQRVERGQLSLESLTGEASSIRKLMWKYRDQPMSYADACLVRLSERFRGGKLLTVDSDFHVYRRNGRDKIPLIAPENLARQG